MSGLVKDRLVVDGVTLETGWIAPPAGEAPTVVMLHEGLGCVAMWGGFPAALADATGCGVFVYSRSGYGESDPVALPRPLEYMHDEALRVLPRILELIGFRRGVLLGHSDGASIATIYAGGVQDHRIRGLVLLAPHFFVEDESIASISKAAEAYRAGSLRERLARYHGNNVDCAFNGWNQAWLDPAFRAWDIREQLAYIRVPILIVQGTLDQYGTAAQVRAAEDEAYCPVDVAWLEGVGHAPHHERAEDTVAIVGAFVRRLMEVHGEASGSGTDVEGARHGS